jgi:hypothetical protein
MGDSCRGFRLLIYTIQKPAEILALEWFDSSIAETDSTPGRYEGNLQLFAVQKME